MINQMIFMSGHHRHGWDFGSLAATFGRIGFEEVRRFPPGRASMDDICLDDPADAFETVYIEATKPLT